jgi:DNA-directed RNA polymerase subunit RPC12/RpoP
MYEKAGDCGWEEKEMKATDVKTSAQPVMVMVSGSVVVRCNGCGQLLSDMFKLTGGTVKCPYCKSQYLYHVKLTAKPVDKTNA